MVNVSDFLNGGVSAGQATPGLDPDATPTPPPAPAAAPPAPPKPSVWSRVSSIFTRQQEEAHARYCRLFRLVEIQGRDLTSSQLSELASAMKEAGISAADVESHRQLLRDLARARAAAAAAPSRRAELENRRTILAEAEIKLLAATAARDAAIVDFQNAAQGIDGNYRGESATVLEGKLTAIFGEVPD